MLTRRRFGQLAAAIGARGWLGGTLAGCDDELQAPAPGPDGPIDLPRVHDVGAATFEVRTGSHCSRCPMRRSCPLHERGRQVTE